jgi:hypothetical protein
MPEQPEKVSDHLREEVQRERTNSAELEKKLNTLQRDYEILVGEGGARLRSESARTARS